jgi:hypothetical protein
MMREATNERRLRRTLLLAIACTLAAVHTLPCAAQPRLCSGDSAASMASGRDDFPHAVTSDAARTMAVSASGPRADARWRIGSEEVIALQPCRYNP